MAYRIKNVRYQDEVRHILLQNENGPCPLLAAANALLLRGVIELPGSSLRSRVVSIEELVTLFADRALQQNDASQKQTEIHEPSTEQEKEAILLRKKQSQHQIDELMEILPGLQYGMDINPKFMQGPEGYEYTKNLTAFDLMGVDLVHGWLLDPKDKTSKIIGNKTYNELIEVVVKGKDVEDELKKLQVVIQEKKEIIKNYKTIEITKESNDKEEKGNDEDSEWVQVEKKDEKLEDNPKEANGENDEQNVDEQGNEEDEKPDGKNKLSLESLTNEVADLETKKLELQDLATNGKVVDIFLKETGHQLTRFGLEKLHEHVQELGVCVFFRNNHFSTMTMFEGQLFLLVTDLGYANVDEVVWEKLDAIDGNTDYFNSFFFKPDPTDDFVMDSGNSLTPEQMMAQRGQSEIDYQLALSLSGKGNRGAEDEKVLQAAKKMSLQEWNQNPNSSQIEEKIHEGSIAENNGNERDRQYALSLQSEYEGQDASERLARQLHEEEKRMRKARMENLRRQNTPKSESSCIIS